MKSILMNFKDNVLSKEEMKSLKGGSNGSCGYCTTKFNDKHFLCGSILIPGGFTTGEDGLPQETGTPVDTCHCHTGGGCAYLA